MPSSEYRQWELDMDKEEHKLKPQKTGDGDYDDFDFGDDFVIVDKPDVGKYNDEKKLKKEAEIKDSSKSACLISKPNSQLSADER